MTSSKSYFFARIGIILIDLYWMYQRPVDAKDKDDLVYGNVGHVRIVSCELVIGLIQVFGTQYFCLDLIPRCMSASV